MLPGETGGIPDNSTNSTDWGQVFRDIVSYGATRYLDTQSVNGLYQNGNGGYAMSPDGVMYTLGQPANSAQARAAGFVVTPAMLVIAGVLIYLAVKG